MFTLFTEFRPKKDFLILDKYENKPITFFYDYIPKNINELKINPYNIIMVHEPDEFFGMHTWVSNNSHLFSAILTWNEKVIKSCSNACIFTCNYQQDSIDYYSTFKDKRKNFEVTFLSGIKTLTEGHRLRNQIYILKDDILIPKKWFHVLEDFDTKNGVRPGYGNYDKDISHIPEHLKANPQVYGKRVCYEESMFHVCVENVKHNNWYTEKIGEAFCTKTVPIYYGCPNIGEYYDERGIIKFNDLNELVNIVNSLTSETYYDMLPYINYNYEMALNDTFANNLKSFFDEFIRLNNI